MKKTTIFLFLIMCSLCLWTSCGSDDGCTADDWVGTYTGQATCDDGSTESGSVTISKIDDNTISLTSDGETYEIQVSGCSFSTSDSVDTPFGTFSTNLTGKLDGNSLSLDTELTISGQTISCVFDLNK